MKRHIPFALLFIGFIGFVFSSEVIDYKSIDNLIIHSYIAAIPDGAAGTILYYIQKYYYLFLSFLYFWFLAIICWGIILPLMFLTKTHILAKEYFFMAVITFGISSLMSSFGGALKRAGQFFHGFNVVNILPFLFILGIFFLVALTPIISPQVYYKNNVYGGADYEIYKLILDSKSAIRENSFLPATFRIENAEVEYLSIDERDDYNKQGELLADISQLRYKFMVINDNDLPLKYGEMICEITTPEGETKLFLNYVINVPEMSYKKGMILNFQEFGKLGNEGGKPRYFKKPIPLSKVGNFDSKESYEKKFKINCSPTYSHNDVLLQNSNEEFQINVNNADNILTIKNNSTKSFKYFEIMCFLENGKKHEMLVEVDNNKSLFVPNQERTFTYRDIRLRTSVNNYNGSRYYPSLESCKIVNTQNSATPTLSFLWKLVSFPFTNTLSFFFITIIWCVLIVVLAKMISGRPWR